MGSVKIQKYKFNHREVIVYLYADVESTTFTPDNSVVIDFLYYMFNNMLLSSRESKHQCSVTLAFKDL